MLGGFGSGLGGGAWLQGLVAGVAQGLAGQNALGLLHCPVVHLRRGALWARGSGPELCCWSGRAGSGRSWRGLVHVSGALMRRWGVPCTGLHVQQHGLTTRVNPCRVQSAWPMASMQRLWVCGATRGNMLGSGMAEGRSALIASCTRPVASAQAMESFPIHTVMLRDVSARPLPACSTSTAPASCPRVGRVWRARVWPVRQPPCWRGQGHAKALLAAAWGLLELPALPCAHWPCM